MWLLEHHEVPLVQANLVVLSGAAADVPGQFGAASMTAAMLDEGAAGKAALALADEVEFLGAQLTTAASFDASVVRLSTPAAKLREALDLLADVALAPDFPADELERLRTERLTGAAAGARRSAVARRDRLPAAALRARASLRHGGGRHRGDR